MPRQRMVKPDFFDSESLSECSPISRLAFIGLWVISDDYGNQKAQTKRMKRSIFPYDDDITEDDFKAILCELEKVGCIRGYEIEEERFINIPNFSTYQTIRKPSATNIPAPPKKYSTSTSLVRHWYGTSADMVASEGGSTALVRHQYDTSTSLVPLKKEGTKEEISPYREISNEVEKSGVAENLPANGACVGGENPTPAPSQKSIQDAQIQQQVMDAMTAEAVTCPAAIAEQVKRGVS